MWATARPIGFELSAELNRDLPSNTNWSPSCPIICRLLAAHGSGGYAAR
jgi:hypothetical protein